MAAVSDHVRRDAEHAARTLIRLRVAQYLRRMDEMAKAEVKQAIEEATTNGAVIDGARIGALAADRAVASYGIERVREVFELEETSES